MQLDPSPNKVKADSMELKMDNFAAQTYAIYDDSGILSAFNLVRSTIAANQPRTASGRFASRLQTRWTSNSVQETFHVAFFIFL